MSTEIFSISVVAICCIGGLDCYICGKRETGKASYCDFVSGFLSMMAAAAVLSCLAFLAYLF